MNEREKQKEQRRSAILAAGLDLFVSRGYAATKVEDIAKAADMSAGLLFHYFPSKEALYRELVSLGLEGGKAPMQMDLSSPIGFFQSFAEQLLESARNAPWVAKTFVLMSQAQRSEGTPEPVRRIALRLDTMRQSEDLIRYGQQLGEIRPGDPPALSSAFWCAVQGIMEQFAADPSTPLPKAEWLTDILRNKEKKHA